MITARKIFIGAGILLILAGISPLPAQTLANPDLSAIGDLKVNQDGELSTSGLELAIGSLGCAPVGLRSSTRRDPSAPDARGESPTSRTAVARRVSFTLVLRGWGHRDASRRQPMGGLNLTLILVSAVGFHLTLLVLVILIIREFGGAVYDVVLGRKGRFRFRLRTLLVVALVVRGALALATWETQPATAPDAEAMLWFVVHFAIDFTLLGAGVWALWYLLEEFFYSFQCGPSVHDKYHLGSSGDAPLPPTSTSHRRRIKWWAKKWPDRYRALRPAPNYTRSVGQDKS